MTRTRLALRLLVPMLLAAATTIVTADVASATCGETAKFVGRGNNHYGNRGNIYAFDNRGLACPGQPDAQTIFVRLSSDYQNYIEAGLVQYPSDAAGTGHYFVEYRIAPASVVFLTYNGYVTGNYYSFQVKNGTGTTWQASVCTGNSVSCTYSALKTTPSMLAAVGIPEGESSHYDSTGPLDDYHQMMQTQDPYNGAWSNWAAAACDFGIVREPNWVVRITSQNTWYNEHTPYQPGQC
jgi:hypothetical protein